jgi:putative ABC transport system permease protein
MIRNYLKTALRNLWRKRNYAIINICGLSIVLAACLSIFLILQYEKSFDDFHQNRNRIYRVVSEGKSSTSADIIYSRGTTFPVARQLRIDYPQLENVAQINVNKGAQITVPGDAGSTETKKFKVQGQFFVDPQFFQIFNFPALAGDPAKDLSEPGTAVLTRQTAEKYFGDWRSAIGRSIYFDNSKLFKVVSVIKDPPSNTDFPLEVVLSSRSSSNYTSTDWASVYTDVNTFVVLPPGLSKEAFDNDLEAFSKRYTPEAHAGITYLLQPLNEMHFDERFGTYTGRTFSKALITVLSLIAFFLLLIGCFNYINLATAQAVTRSKEVGIRKVLGGRKTQLIFQFFFETFLVTLVAILFAIGISYLVLPFLNRVMELDIAMHLDPGTSLFLMAILIIVTFLAGLYPSLLLSGFSPILALKANATGQKAGGISVRRTLVVLQFAIAQALIIATLIIVGQMSYFQNSSMGFQRDAVLDVTVPNDSLSGTRYATLKAELLRQPGITDVSFSTFSIADNVHWDIPFKFDNSSKDADFNANLMFADADLFKFYGLTFVAGRPYYKSDTIKEFVVNETMLNKLGIRKPEDILGKKISFWDNNVTASVVGVVKDFHNSSLEKPIDPLIFSTWSAVYDKMSVKFKPQNTKQVLAVIQSKWNEAFPKSVYEYQFLSNKIANFYQQEDAVSYIYKVFAGIAILISCLGLYGLISFMALQRTKEVGIRKSMGASTARIVVLFMKEFTMLILIAFFIAMPVAWYFMNNWLNKFAFRINIGLSYFLLTFIASIIIAWLAVGYRALKAASASPVKSLRNLE